MTGPDYDFAKPIACPWCKHKLDMALGIGDDKRPPEAGDLLLCIKCGRLGFLLGISEIRKPAYEEVAEAIVDHPELVAALLAWDEAFGRTKKRKSL